MVWHESEEPQVARIRRQRRVTLYYFDRDSPAYVTITGLARLRERQGRKKRSTGKTMKPFYPTASGHIC